MGFHRKFLSLQMMQNYARQQVMKKKWIYSGMI